MPGSPSFGSRLLSLFFEVAGAIAISLFSGLIEVALDLLAPILQALLAGLGMP